MLRERHGKRAGKGSQRLGIEKEALLKKQENLNVKRSELENQRVTDSR